MNVQNLKTLLALIAGGKDVDGSWEVSGFSSRAEAKDAIESLSRSLGDPPPAVRPRGLDRAILHADGASRGNPGPSAIAAIIHLPTGEELASVAKRIGRATNNVAEYRAVIEGMKLARDIGIRELTVFVDSELVMKQLTGAYRIRSRDLEPLAREVAAEARHFGKCAFKHVKREENREADRMANEALNRIEDS
ncbi:MAG: ribonuclease HI family protein [Candidatus Krumholzibacteria bacterium]|nr:ribonuclease HI family protein [Candidatus Krumholzibacteria bacterium]